MLCKDGGFNEKLCVYIHTTGWKQFSLALPFSCHLLQSRSAAERTSGVENGNGEEYITMSFMICTSHQILFGRSNEKESDGLGKWDAWGTGELR